MQQCELCGMQRELQQSHIIPKFVYSWFKRTSPGALRTTLNPNMRIQDGLKEELFCVDCEQRLNAFETPFCNEIFVPLNSPDPLQSPISYRGWALKFAVSVSYRVLLHYSRIGLEHLSAAQEEAARKALAVWRDFLLGSRKHPAEFEQHLLPVDAIEEHTTPGVSPFINRYLMRAVDMDVISSPNSAIVYSKLFRVVIFGFIHMERSGSWKGTKLHVHKGLLGGPVTYHLPAPIVEYMNHKADHAMAAHDQISKKQRDKIAYSFQKDIDAIAQSELARAMSYDVMHSGDAAFRKGNED